MSYGIQPQAKKPSRLPKILTIICSVLAVIFLLVSATMFVSARSKAQEIEDARAEIQSADAKTVQIDSEITSTKEQIDKAKAKKDAQEWCDSLTRETATAQKIKTQGKSLKSMSQNQSDAIESLCPKKKAFAAAFAQDMNPDMVKTDNFRCEKDGNTATITATITVDAPSVLALGSADVTFDVFVADHEITDSDTPVTSTSVTVPSSGSAPLSVTFPISGNETRCLINPEVMWPTGL